MLIINKFPLIIQNKIIKLYENNRYTNATCICEMTNKNFNIWLAQDSTKRIIKIYEKKLLEELKPCITLIKIRPISSALSGSWIHILLLLHLVKYCIPDETQAVETWIKQSCCENMLKYIYQVETSN